MTPNAPNPIPKAPAALLAALLVAMLVAAPIAAPIAALTLIAPRAMAAENPALRVAVLKFGTVNWLMSAIADNRLDAAEGYRLDVLALAGKPATGIAFQAGDADVIVTDWMWSQQRRDKGLDLRFAPYSVALGALMTNGAVRDLCDLKGRKVGVVGGESDKSWIVYRTLARRDCGFDLAAETETMFGAPPLMARQLDTGAVDAVSTFWHWAARMEARGKTRLLGVDEAMAALGIAPAPPLIGFVWDAGRSDPRVLAAFLRSVTAAQALLRESDAEWDRLRPKMKVKGDAEFIALRDRFRAGMVEGWTPAHMTSARKLHALLVQYGGARYAAGGGALDAEGFAPPGDDGR